MGSMSAKVGLLAVVTLIIGIIAGTIVGGFVLQPAPRTVVETKVVTQQVSTTATAFSTITQTVARTVERTVRTTEVSTLTAITTVTLTISGPVKGEWVTDDGSLKVSAELIPEMIGSTIVSYKLRVTITNVSDKQFDRVIIVVFPYIGDRLYEYWSMISYSEVKESIVPGESITHEFTLLPADMTSYKLKVFGV